MARVKRDSGGKKPGAKKPTTHRELLVKRAQKLRAAYVKLRTKAATVSGTEGSAKVLRLAAAKVAESMVSRVVGDAEGPFSYESIKGEMKEELKEDPEVADLWVSEVSASLSGALEWVLIDAAGKTAPVVNRTLLEEEIDNLKDQVIDLEELLKETSADESPMLQDQLKQQLAEAKNALEPFK